MSKLTTTQRRYLKRLTAAEITVPAGNSQLLTLWKRGLIDRCGAGVDDRNMPTTRWRITEAGRRALEDKGECQDSAEPTSCRPGG